MLYLLIAMSVKAGEAQDYTLTRRSITSQRLRL